jgi:hypothetical protein
VDWLSAHAAEVGSFIGRLITGAVGGSLITLNVSRQNRVKGSSGTITDQSRARAGGDVVGRDKKTS